MKNKIFKALSILLALAVILSTCVCVVGTVSAAEAVFYVSAEGSDENAGTSLETAVASYGKAIELANAQYGSGDNITIKLTGTEVQMGTVPEYAYNLAVEGIDETKTQITSTSSRGNIANGPASSTSFSNVSFSGPQYTSFMFNNSKKVIFDSDTSGFTSVRYAALGTYNDGGAAKTSNGHDVEFYGSVGYVYLSNTGWQSKTVMGDVNITFAGGGSPNFFFNPSSNSSITLKKNLNLNIKKANSITFTNPTGGRITVDGAIQIVNSAGASVSVNDAVLSTIDCDKYVITNATGKSDIIEFTETAGKFKVDKSATSFDIIATDSEGNITKADDNGYLTLPKSGDYELSLYRDPITAVYYVSAKTGATDNDGTKASPFLTVFDAINQGNTDGYTNKDTVVVKLLDEELIQWGDVQTTPAHTFKLVVESDDRNNYSTVDILQATYLGGPTELKYGKYKIENQYSQIRINNKEFILDSTAHFSCGYFTFGDNSTQNTIPGHKVVFNNSIGSTHIYLSNNLHSNGKKYTGDVEVVVNNPEARPVLRLGGQDGTVTYKANVNFNVKDAKRISFGSEAKGKNVCEGAIQLIANSKTEVDADGVDYLKTTCNPAKGFYYLINNSDYKDAIEFTTTEGKYAVDTETYSVTAVGENGTFEAVDGFLTVDGAGEYIVTVTKKTVEADNTIYEKLDNATLNVWENDGEIAIDNAESVATINFGNKTYKDVKISVINAEKITFAGEPTVNGLFEIVVNGETQILGKDVFDNAAAGRGKWYVTNNSGCKAVWGDEDGELLYFVDGKELEIVKGETVIAPKFQNFLLNEGEYELRVKAKTDDKYSDFIDYRGTNLSNTYAKIKKGEKLNVVYMGGSVTNGSGASDNNVTSWRALVGQWLKNTYTNTEITNVNAAIGATGSVYGTYRLDRHVLNKEPDLFFIEFSINDFLDWHYVTKDYAQIASQHMETIIRRIRTMYPDCDIVMLHTTDKTTTTNYTSKGEYYPEAQAHNDLAKAYNIPTIDIGGSLINYMGENWASDEVWNQYLTDTVHPSDKGYEVYFNTIKEYLVNTLIYGDNSTEIKEHKMPQMVNEVLIDGDLTHYDVTKELLAKSEELGGSGFTYVGSESFVSTEYGGIKSTDANSVFAFEFTGTEFAVVSDGSHTGYLVKIDDGEYIEIAKNGMTRPNFLAKGLTSGKHTIYIKPKDENKVITLISLYTRDETKATKRGAGHSFTNYLPNNDATCQNNGTETAVCDCGCGDTNTRDIPNSYADHVYDDGCDVDCNECGATRTTTHVYDNDCDADCNECGATRTPADHVYDNDCDADCNECGAEREAADHVYDNACDADCNECGEARTPADHVYDGETDIDCNECGATRVLGDQLVKEADGTYYYYKDGVKQTDYEGLVKFGGKWFYVKDGAWQRSNTGLVKFSGKWFYVVSGKWSTSVTKVLKKYDGKWFWIVDGKWNSKTEDLVKCDGVYFYIKGGKWDSKTATKLFEKNGTKFYIKGGKWNKATTLFKQGSKLVAIKSGKVTTAKVIIKYNGKKYYCYKGYAQTSKTGKVTVSGKTYTVKKGIVK